jgi:hypothetical protein
VAAHRTTETQPSLAVVFLHEGGTARGLGLGITRTLMMRDSQGHSGTQLLGTGRGSVKESFSRQEATALAFGCVLNNECESAVRASIALCLK